METRSTCRYCGVGCGVVIEHDGGAHHRRARRSRPSGQLRPALHQGRDAAPDRGAAALAARARASASCARDARGAAQRVDWDAALDHAADRFAACIREHGPDSVAFYVSGQLLTEDYYVFNKLAKGLDRHQQHRHQLAAVHVERGGGLQGRRSAPTRRPRATRTSTTPTASSSPARTRRGRIRSCSAASRRRRRAIPTLKHHRRRSAPHRRPRERADLHLAIEPGTDVALFHGMLHVHAVGRAGRPRVTSPRTPTGFDALKRDRARVHAARWSPRSAASPRPTSSPPRAGSAKRAPRCRSTARASTSRRRGTAKNAALINLHLATGQIGKPGAGPFSLTGQPNAMGGREVGGMANLLLGASRPRQSRRIAPRSRALWGVDARAGAARARPRSSCSTRSPRATVKMVWIACTNPAQSLPDQATRARGARARGARRAAGGLRRHRDRARSPTCCCPRRRGARRTARSPTPSGASRACARPCRRPARRAPTGRSPPISRGGSRRGCGRRSADAVPVCDAPPRCFAEHVATHARPRSRHHRAVATRCSKRDGPQQWPFREGDAAGRDAALRRRRVRDARRPRALRRRRRTRRSAERVDARYPFRLNTGRLRDQWHGMSRTGTVAQLFAHAPEPRAGDATRPTWRGAACATAISCASNRGAAR